MSAAAVVCPSSRCCCPVTQHPLRLIRISLLVSSGVLWPQQNAFPDAKRLARACNLSPNPQHNSRRHLQHTVRCCSVTYVIHSRVLGVVSSPNCGCVTLHPTPPSHPPVTQVASAAPVDAARQLPLTRNPIIDHSARFNHSALSGVLLVLQAAS